MREEGGRKAGAQVGRKGAARNVESTGEGRPPDHQAGHGFGERNFALAATEKKSRRRSSGGTDKQREKIVRDLKTKLFRRKRPQGNPKRGERLWPNSGNSKKQRRKEW